MRIQSAHARMAHDMPRFIVLSWRPRVLRRARSSCHRSYPTFFSDGDCFLSSAATRASSSAASIARTWVEISPLIWLASCGDSSPAAQAVMTADDALTASAALSISRQFEFDRAFASGRH